jgi:thioredoxin 1
MLHTNLNHIESDEDYRKVITENENVMICCGRMGPMCIPVYSTMVELRDDYPHVAFYDMEFDIPAAAQIKQLPECQGFMGLPFTVYYKHGKVVKATSSIQTPTQITDILNHHFSQ